MTAEPGDVIAACRRAGLTVGVAESLTAGLVAARLADVPGASAVLRGAVVAYATDLKHALLGVDADLLARSGAVNAEVAEQMADGARRTLRADLAVATTGVAGPDPQDGVPPGTVFLAVSAAAGTRAREARLRGDRRAVREGTVDLALDLLLAAASAPRR